jgi:hypothetical protein
MRLLFAILTVFLFSLAEAQSDSWIEFRGSHGFFIPHRTTLPQLQQGHAKSFELSYIKQTDGSETWHQDYKGPQTGIGFWYIDMGNRRELGDFFALYPFIGVPLAGDASNGLMLRMGVGLAYLTKTYDLQENMFNTAIGSKINYNFLIAMRYQRSMGRFMMSTGLSISHASNASIRLPNLGVNVANADLTLAWRTTKEAHPFIRTDAFTKAGVSSWTGIVSVGMRQSDSFLNNEHGVQELRLMWENDFSRKLSYDIGADLIHNRATYQEFDTDTLSGLFFLQAGLHIGIKMRFGKSSLFLHNGFYVNQGVQEQGGLYHRFGGRRSISERMFLELSLKTHYAKADYLALGMGYTFNSKEKKLKR